MKLVRYIQKANLSHSRQEWWWALCLFLLAACDPEPPLHLYDAQGMDIEIEAPEIELNIIWNYELETGKPYNWEDEWYYGWDDDDRERFGELNYTGVNAFNLRRYYTGEDPKAPHTGYIPKSISGNISRDRYDWGFWDILCWNQVQTINVVQNLYFDEETSLDYVTASTGQTMSSSRYHAPKYTHSFYEPEPLFAAYEEDIEINRNLDGFTYNPERNVWTRTLKLVLQPLTYVYMTQVILHNNKGRVTSIETMGNLSGMAKSTTLNTGLSGDDAITVNYNIWLKKDMPLVPYNVDASTVPDAEIVDIVGGRLMTFGICNTMTNEITSPAQIHDSNRHYMDLTMQFYNGMDSTFVFDVTDQVRKRYKGGVLTVELDMDTVPIPRRNGGSGFDAVVKDLEDGGTHEIEL